MKVFRIVRGRDAYADSNTLLIEDDTRIVVFDPTTGSRLVFARTQSPLPRAYPHAKKGDALPAFALVEEWEKEGLVRRIRRDDSGRARGLQDRYGNITTLNYGTGDVPAAPGVPPPSVLASMVDVNGNATRFTYTVDPSTAAAPGAAPPLLLTKISRVDGPMTIVLDYEASRLRHVWQNGGLVREYTYDIDGHIARIVNGDRTGMNFTCAANTEKLQSDFRRLRSDVSRLPLRHNQLNIQPFTLPSDGAETAIPQTNVFLDPTSGDVRGLIDRASGRMEEYLYSDDPVTFGGPPRSIRFHERRATLRYGVGPRFADRFILRRGDYSDGDAKLQQHDADTPRASCGNDAAPPYPLAPTRPVTVLDGVKVVAGASDFVVARPSDATQGSYKQTEFWYTRAGSACGVRVDRPSSVPNAGRHQDTTFDEYRDAVLPAAPGYAALWPSGDLQVAHGTNDLGLYSFCYDQKNRLVAVGGGLTLLADGACGAPSNLFEKFVYTEPPGTAADGAVATIVRTERIAAGESRTRTTTFDAQGRLVDRKDSTGPYTHFDYRPKGVSVTTQYGSESYEVVGPVATATAYGATKTTRRTVDADGSVKGAVVDIATTGGTALLHRVLTLSDDGSLDDAEEDLNEHASGNLSPARRSAK